MEEKDWNIIAKEALQNDLAFDELYEHFFPRIYNLIYARVKDAATADDIVSDVFEKMVTHLDSFDSTKASFATWLSRIATRTLTDYYRWQSHRQNVEWDDVFSPKVDDKDAPDGQLLEQEGKKELLLALGKLSEREQQIVELKFLLLLSAKFKVSTPKLSTLLTISLRFTKFEKSAFNNSSACVLVFESTFKERVVFSLFSFALLDFIFSFSIKHNPPSSFA